MNKPQTGPPADVGIFQIAILVLSLLALAALAADTVRALPPAVHSLIQIFDTAVCVVLLVDFFVRLHHADSKWVFMKWGWIDLIASIPNLDVLRWGRLVRVLRVIRLLRGVRSVHRILGTTEGTIKVTVHRLRQRYRERLRAVVSQTVSNPIEVDAEIAHLLAALRG